MFNVEIVESTRAHHVIHVEWSDGAVPFSLGSGGTSSEHVKVDFLFTQEQRGRRRVYSKHKQRRRWPLNATSLRRRRRIFTGNSAI